MEQLALSVLDSNFVKTEVEITNWLGAINIFRSKTFLHGQEEH